MFKKENSIWLYLIGIIVMFAILLLYGRDFLTLTPLKQNTREEIKVSRPLNTLEKGINYIAIFTTNMGVFNVDLFENEAPQNVNNFKYLAEVNYYDGTKFHRLIPSILIQGGDRNTLNNNPDDDGKGRTSYLIKDEVNFDALELSQEKKDQLINEGYKSTPELKSKAVDKYALVMANDGPNTNSSQFFIVLGDRSNPTIEQLNGRFTVIGTVISNFDVINNLSLLQVDDLDSNTPHPEKEVIIENIEILAM